MIWNPPPPPKLAVPPPPPGRSSRRGKKAAAASGGPAKKGRPKPRAEGVVTVAGHCTFTWRSDDGSTMVAVVHALHCSECVAALADLGFVTPYARQR